MFVCGNKSFIVCFRSDSEEDIEETQSEKIATTERVQRMQQLTRTKYVISIYTYTHSVIGILKLFSTLVPT